MTDHEQRAADGLACLEAALEYIARGWSAIPLCPWDHVGVGKEHGHKCKSPGKAPLISWTVAQQRAATESEIRSWWRQWPNANVGIVLGSVSGLVGVDMDGSEAQGAVLTLNGRSVVPSFRFATPGGGRRYLYVIPAGEILPGRKHPRGEHQGLEILAEGTQTVAPPSRHPSGGYYVWEPLTAKEMNNHVRR